MQYPIKIPHDNKNYLLPFLPESIESLNSQILKQVFKNQEDLGFELHYFDNEGDKIQIETEEDYQTFYKQEVEPQKKGSKVFVTNVHQKEVQEKEPIDREEDDFWIIKKDELQDNQPLQQSQNQSRQSFEKFISLPQGMHIAKDLLSQQMDYDQKEFQFLQEQLKKEEEQMKLLNQLEEQKLQQEQQSQILKEMKDQEKLELNLKLQKESELSNQKSKEFQIPQNRPISSDSEDLLQGELLENKIEKQLKAESFDQKPNPLLVSMEIYEKEEEQKSIQELVALEVKNLLPEIVKQVEQNLRSKSEEDQMNRLSFRMNENQNIRVPDQQIPLKVEAEKTQEKPVHQGITCDVCNQYPIVGIRYKCTVNYDYDLCEKCEAKNKHPFPLVKIRQPGSYSQIGNFKEVILDVFPFFNKDSYKRKENEEKYGQKKEPYKKCEREAYKKSEKEQSKAEKEQKKADKEAKKAAKEAQRILEKEEKKARKAELVTQIMDLFGVEVKKMDVLKKIHPDFNVSYIIDHLLRNQIILEEL